MLKVVKFLFSKRLTNYQGSLKFHFCLKNMSQLKDDTTLADSFPYLQKTGLLNNNKVIINNLKKTECLLKDIIQGGFQKLQFIVDFDDTLTKVYCDGKRCDCSWGIIDNSPLVPPYYNKESRKLYEKYYPIEIDPNLTEKKKIPHMIEWYDCIKNLLRKYQINKSMLESMVSKSSIALRDGVPEMLEMLDNQKVPVLILSAGIGDLIQQVFVHFNGGIVNFIGDLIHMFNKNEDAIHSSDYFQLIKSRTNVILMGDSVGDIKMAHGVPSPNTILKIGYLNEKVDDRLPSYREAFDIVLTECSSVDVVMSVIKHMV